MKNKHSKLDDLDFTDLKCAPYLENQSINQREAKLLFKLRTRMYQVKSNYKGLYINNLTCDLCKSATCDQRHLLSCTFTFLFGTIDQMVPAIKLFSKITEQRDELFQILFDN